MKKALVTGGAGFVGHHLSHALINMGVEVNILDDLSNGFEENIPNKAEFIKGDIRDAKAVEKAMQGCDAVFHLAARVELQRSIVDPADCYSVNVAGTAQIIQECLKENNRRMVFASSCAVYPIHPTSPLSESMATAGETPYALSKKAGEDSINIFNKLRGLNACSLRCFNIYGPRQRVDSLYAAVIPKFIDRVLKEEPLLINGDGLQTRDFIHVSDMVKCYLTAAQSNESGVFNAGTGVETSVKKLAETIIEIHGSGKVEHKPALSGDASASKANMAHTEKFLGFKCEKDLKSGLQTVYDSLRN